MSSSAISQTSAPRLDALDVLRGFALFGILVVNLPFFAHPIYTVAASGHATAWFDQLARAIVAFAFEAKFYVLFAFLFGYGLSVQLARASSAGDSPGPRYLRRLIGLLFFGVLHAVLLFVGDILVSYVVLGIFLWLLRDWEPRTLLWFAGGMMVVAVIGRIVLGLVASGGDFQSTTELALLADQASRNYLGTFGSAVAQRVQDLLVFYSFTPLFNWPTMMAMFALGLATGKQNVFADLPRYTPLVRRLLPWALLLGVGGNLLYAAFMHQSTDPMLSMLALTVEALAAPALTFCYVVGVIWLAQHPTVGSWLAPLRSTGRMSLTNYLVQAIICSIIFNGWGFGLFGQIGSFGLLLLAPAIYALQVVGSTLWLRYFRLGPDEWLLRSWTYLRWQPFRRTAVVQRSPQLS
jgi:uncharacterized protein